VEPIFRRLREYLLEPLALLHEKLDIHAAETRAAIERMQLQVQVMRGDLDVLPKQLVQLEFRSRNFAKQIAHLESQFGILANQLNHFELPGGSLRERTEPLKSTESLFVGDESSSLSSEAVVIIGSGGHAKVVIELLRAGGKHQIKGCTGLGESGFVLGDVPILGTDSLLPALLASGAKKAFVAIGDNHLRLRLLAQVSEMGFELINAVSRDAVVSRSATLGRGLAIMAGAIVNASAEIGDGAIINTNAAVDHDCRIGSGAHIGPGSALAGNVEVGCESFLGAGTCVIPGVRIGNRAIIGAGSVVVQNIPDGVTAIGVPARITGEVKTPSN
jgi:UDP-perosamine 4-acetyltransferase